MEKIIDYLSHELKALRFLLTTDQDNSSTIPPNPKNTFQNSLLMLENIISNTSELSFFVINRSFSYGYFNHAHRVMVKTLWGNDIFLGGNLFEMIAHKDEERIRISRYFERAFKGETYKLIHQYNDGRSAYYESTFHPIKGKDDTIDNVAVLSIDISPYFKDRKALKTSQRKYFDLIKEHRDGFALLDKKGKFVMANDSFLSMLGYTNDELTDLTEKEITPYSPESSNIIPFNEKKYRHKKGHPISVEHHSYPVYDEHHKTEGRWSHVRDMSQQKKHIRDEYILEHKSKTIEFLSENIAKKVNQAINTILNQAGIIKEWNQESIPLLNATEKIIEHTHYISNWINGLVQFTFNGEERTRYSKISHISDHAVTLSNIIMGERPIEITTDIDENLPHIKCCRQHIEQVLIHLIFLMADSLLTDKNAREKDSQRVNQKIVQLNSYVLKERDKEWLRISVVDRDLQFLPSLSEQLTDAFSKKEWQKEEDFKYLAACHHIVDNHGGRLHMESVSDVYSQFHTDLPIDKKEGEKGYP